MGLAALVLAGCGLECDLARQSRWPHYCSFYSSSNPSSLTSDVCLGEERPGCQDTTRKAGDGATVTLAMSLTTWERKGLLQDPSHSGLRASNTRSHPEHCSQNLYPKHPLLLPSVPVGGRIRRLHCSIHLEIEFRQPTKPTPQPHLQEKAFYNRSYLLKMRVIPHLPQVRYQRGTQQDKAGTMMP